MDEHLQFHILTRFTNSLDLLERQFPCKHHSFESKANQFLYPGDGMYSQLGTCVEREARGIGFYKVDQAQVLDDDAVTTDEVNMIECLVCLIQL